MTIHLYYGLLVEINCRRGRRSIPLRRHLLQGLFQRGQLLFILRPVDEALQRALVGSVQRVFLKHLDIGLYALAFPVRLGSRVNSVARRNECRIVIGNSANTAWVGASPRGL